MAQPVILISHDVEQMSQEAANRFTQLARQQVRTSGRFSAALAGGSTPKRLYELLAGKPRVTLTLPVLNHARHLMWLVAGPEKASRVRAVLERGDRPEEVPAGRVKSASGKTFWFLDRAAASLLRTDQVRAGESA